MTNPKDPRTPRPTITKPIRRHHAKRQDEDEDDEVYTQPTQELPAWMSYSTTTIPNVTPGATGIVTVNVVNLPLTYYGPSIPLGTDGYWVYGGLTSPGPTPTESTTESEPSTTPPPTTTPAPTTSSPTSSSQATTSTPFSSSLSIEPSSTDPQGSISGGATESPVTAGTPNGPRFSSGAVVAAVVCGFVALVLAIVLFILIRKWGLVNRRSYYRSSRSEEEMYGGGEVTSLLSGRLAGGESPPAPRSPTASMRSALGPAMRPRTPLSTRALSTRQGYAQAANNTPPALPPRPRSPSPQHVVSRASTDEVHRRSDQSQQQQNLPAINVQRATMSPVDRISNFFHLRRSPRDGPPTASVMGYIPFLTPRTRQRTLSELGEGWQEVQAPPPAVMGLGIHIPEEQQYSNAPPTPFPPASMNTSSLPSRMDRPHSTLMAMDRPGSTVSGQTVYVDARSRPTSPGMIGAVPPSLGAQSREMSQRDLGHLVSRTGTGQSQFGFMGSHIRPKPSDSSLTGPQLQKGELAPDPASTYYVSVSPYGDDDDALDAPVPVGLLPPGLEHSRSFTERARWSKSAIEEEDEGDILAAKGLAGGKATEYDALLDDAPPAPVKKWTRSVSPDSGAASGSAVASQLSLARSREHEERDIADDDSYFQDVGGPARRTRFVTATPIILGGAASRDSDNTQGSASQMATMTYGTTDTGTNRQTLATSVNSPTFIEGASGTPFEMVTPAVVGSNLSLDNEWTLGLDASEPDEEQHPYPLQSIYEWFRLNPASSSSQPELAPGPTFGIPASGGPPIIVAGRARPEDDHQSTSEEGSSLLRGGNGSENGRRRSRLSDVILEEPEESRR